MSTVFEVHQSTCGLELGGAAKFCFECKWFDDVRQFLFDGAKTAMNFADFGKVWLYLDGNCSNSIRKVKTPNSKENVLLIVLAGLGQVRGQRELEC